MSRIDNGRTIDRVREVRDAVVTNALGKLERRRLLLQFVPSLLRFLRQGPQAAAQGAAGGLVVVVGDGNRLTVYVLKDTRTPFFVNSTSSLAIT